MRGFLLLLVLSFLPACSSFVERSSPEGGEPEIPETFLHSSNNESSSKRAGSWWRVFDDPALNRLMKQLHRHNPDLEAALARLDQSFSVFDQTRAGLWPTLRGRGVARNRQDSVNELLFPLDRPEYERFQLAASVSWEVDLWGRVRGMARRDRLLAEGEAETFIDAVLSLEGNLARQYFAWRNLAAEKEILDEAVTFRDERLTLERSRLELGTGVQMEVGRSLVELNTARAAAEATDRSKGKLANAMAVLVGSAPSGFEKPKKRKARKALPKIPDAVPAALLVNRPDLRAARKKLEAAAVQVGVRRADFLPRISLTGSGGVASLKTSNLFRSDSLLFDIGPELEVPIFPRGRQAVEQARAIWRERVAEYRSLFLNAVREVDDALLELKSLARELESQRQVVAAAVDGAEIAQLRYDRGLVSYLEVIESERDRLTALRNENALVGEQFASTVRLIQALGGRW